MDNTMTVDAGTREVTSQTKRPRIGFHMIRGANIVLQKDGRAAKRFESFCEGVAFSNRPVDIDENICVKLTEDATSWSGVLRFGVTNIDPKTYRNIPLPRFVCPDLIDKKDCWAKSLAEIYSVKGNILNFHVNRAGELYYGINGAQKELFLSDINTNTPIWLVFDIYGNSVALEFLESSEYPTSRPITPSTPSMPASRIPSPPSASDTVEQSHRSLTNARTRNIRNVLGDNVLQHLRFHQFTGHHITLNTLRDTATRRISEFSLGYAFSERPIKNNEVVCIQVADFESMYHGGIAFGLTSCNPSTLRVTDLPEDSSNLLELPDYWVGIKDVAGHPKVNSILRFWITQQGEVFFELDKEGARSILFVDNSIDLYMYFDLFGTTRSIKMLGTYEYAQPPNIVPSTNSIASSSTQSTTRNISPLSIPVRPSRATPSSSTRSKNKSRGYSGEFHQQCRQEHTFAGTLLNAPKRRIDSSLENMVQSSVPRTPPGPRTTPTMIPERPRMPATMIPARPRTIPRLEPARPSANPFQSSNLSPVSSRGFSHRRSHEMSAPPRRLPPPIPQSTAVKTKLQENSKETNPKNNEGECVICMEAKVDAVLYTCGHMCMCYSCGQRITQSVKPRCPICRATILDVIRCYKS